MMRKLSVPILEKLEAHRNSSEKCWTQAPEKTAELLPHRGNDFPSRTAESSGDMYFTERLQNDYRQCSHRLFQFT